MSRIGKLPITIPAGVTVEVDGKNVKVKGPKGELSRTFTPVIEIKQEDSQILVTRSSDEKNVRALHGTTRAVIQTMVTGVSDGFSHPVVVEPPAGIQFDVTEKNRMIVVSGSSKEVVGQVAADIRKIRPPEPYKGKGIRYLGERVRRKAGKTAAA